MAKKKTTKKRQVKKKPVSQPKHTGDCFVIMPFGGWPDIYYDAVFRPAIEKTGLRARRADDIFKPTSIVGDIWDLTLNAKVLLADLTGKNPNVLYELGLAHACCKPVVIITESFDDVPFDLQSLRVIRYDKNEPKWGQNLATSIKESLLEVLDDPAASVPTPYLAKHPEFPKSRATATNKELFSLRSENRKLKRQVHQMGTMDYSISTIENMVEQYLNDGVPSDVILNRLTKRGIPRSHVRSVLNAMKHMIRNKSSED